VPKSRKAPPNLDLRGTTWHGHVKIAGKRYRTSLYTDDEKEAESRVKAWIKKLNQQAFGEKSPAPTFTAAALYWGENVLPSNVKPQVIRRYLTSTVSLQKFFKDTPVDKIDGPMVYRYCESRRREVTNATLRRDLTALSSLLSSCTARGIITTNVAATFDRRNIKERREPISLVRAEAYQAVLDDLPPAMADLLRLLDQSGMRLNEAVTLERHQVNFDSKQVFLDKTKTNRPRVIDFKTAGGDAGSTLEQFRKKSHGHLFVNREGEPYGNFSSNFGAIARRLVKVWTSEKREFHRFRVHDLRHMFAIRWLKGRGNIYRLSRHLGHTSVKTTEIYLAYLSESEHEAARFGENG
jgi:integrase/recombinase XerD